MVQVGELTGPKVHVERVGTADVGAGQIVALGTELVVRAARHTRAIGGLSGLQAIELQDRRGSGARLRFDDGGVWLLTETRDDSLLPFLTELAERSLRPGLIVHPPSVSMRVREAISPSRRGEWIAVVIAVLAMAPLAWVCAQLPWLGYALIAAVLGWLVVLLLADRNELDLPQMLARLQWPAKLALPILVSLAAALGVLQGRQHALAEQAALRAREQAELAELRADGRRLLEQEVRKLSIARAAADLQAALTAGDAAAIEQQATRLRALEPGHPALAAAKAPATQPAPPRSEEERRAAIAVAVRAARRVTADRVHCDSARDVGDVWSGLSLVSADDPERREAQKLVPRLERCRAGLRRSLIDNAARVRRTELDQAARRLEVDLRASGHSGAVKVRSTRQGFDVTVEVPGIAQDAAASLLRPEATASLQSAGASTVIVGDGGRVRVPHALSPPSLPAFADETLAGFGLGQPLALR